MYWRPIVNEKPDDFEHVLVTVDGQFGEIVMPAQYKRIGIGENAIYKFVHLGEDDSEISPVTAWMRYPTPYHEPHEDPGDFEETAEMFIECTFCESCEVCAFFDKCEQYNEEGIPNCKTRLAYMLQTLLDKMNKRFEEMTVEEFKEILCTM